MTDFYQIITDDDYKRLTLKSYIDCYDKLDKDKISVLTGLYNKLSNYTIKPSHEIINDSIAQGFRLSKCTRKPDVLGESMAMELSKLDELISQIDPKNSKDVAFVASLVSLAKVLDNLTDRELATLNKLYGFINFFDYSLDKPINVGEDKFYMKAKK